MCIRDLFVGVTLNILCNYGSILYCLFLFKNDKDKLLAKYLLTKIVILIILEFNCAYLL